jgi:hypothetical protein
LRSSLALIASFTAVLMSSRSMVKILFKSASCWSRPFRPEKQPSCHAVEAREEKVEGPL